MTYGSSMGLRRRWIIGISALLAVPLALGACSGDSGSSSGTKFNKVGASLGASDAGGVLAGAARVPNGTAAGSQTATNRDVIYTGALTVRVGDAKASAERARRLADDVGGYLAAADADLTGGTEVRVRLRVPAKEFDRVMAAMAKEGKVEERKVDSEDVTDQVVDLQGRLKNATTSADRLRELLAKAENVQNVIAIEDRLTQRETEIEAITGQLEAVQDQVAYATVRVTFTEQDAPTVSDDLPGPIEALRAGGVAVVNLLLILLAAAAFLLPFVPLGLFGWWLLRIRRRRQQKRRVAASPPPPVSATPPVAPPPAPAPPPDS